jgi:hypothetical protein
MGSLGETESPPWREAEAPVNMGEAWTEAAEKGTRAVRLQLLWRRLGWLY